MFVSGFVTGPKDTSMAVPAGTLAVMPVPSSLMVLALVERVQVIEYWTPPHFTKQEVKVEAGVIAAGYETRKVDPVFMTL